MRALLLAMLVLVAQARAEPLTGTLLKLRDSGRIGLGIRDRSLPFGYLDGGKPVGYGIDMCLGVVAAIERELGVGLRVEMIPVQSVTRFSLLAGGTIDLDCGTTSNTAERQRQAAFSNTYFLTSTGFVSRRDTPIVSIEGLRGLTVAITANTTNLEQLRAADAARQLGLKLLVTKDTGEGFTRFAAGEADAFVADDILLAALIAAAPDPARYMIASERLSGPEPYAIMLRRDDPAFKAVVDRATSTLLSGREGPALYAQWFEAPLPGRGIRLGLPMSPALRRAFEHPTDTAEPAAYEQ